MDNPTGPRIRLSDKDELRFREPSLLRLPVLYKPNLPVLLKALLAKRSWVGFVIVVHALSGLLIVFEMAGAVRLFIQNPVPFVVPASTTEPTFTPLQKYYISPNGSDAANGLTRATAWKTPNHALNCGDVLIATTGTYTSANFAGNFGVVSNCPSTTGGIDGTGGIYFAVLLCEGPDLVSCPVTGTGMYFRDQKSHWAVQGFLLSGNTSDFAFNLRIINDACDTGETMTHIASINNVVIASKQAFGMNDCGTLQTQNPPASDYIAVVGTIAQNSAQDTICLAAIDLVGNGASDGATTAIKGFIYGNFAFSSAQTGCNSTFDVEGIMIDTVEAHSSNGIWVVQNNMMWNNGRYGFQLFWQCITNTAFTVRILNNTAYGNNAAASTVGAIGGEFNISANDSCAAYNPIPVTVEITNNIGMTAYANSPTTGVTDLYALVIAVRNHAVESHWGNLTNGGTGSENVWKSIATSCITFNSQGGCDSGNNIDWTDSTSRLGTNFYIDPVFTNATDLLASRTGAPDCTGFRNVTVCMGWNANTQTLTVPSVISDLMPTAGSALTKGYQKPSTTCGPNANYPTWLKGIVYLQVQPGDVIVQKADLVSRPCGL